MNCKGFEEFCVLNKIKYEKDVPLSLHTSFKIGGNADYFVNASSAEELSALIKELLKLEIPYFIIGKGSNLLVSDKGFRGVIIKLSGLDKIEINENIAVAGAGASLTALCLFVADKSLTGLEFAYGIPGTVGGALFMNAGAYGGEMCQVVKSAEYIDSFGEIKTISMEDMALGYRTSVFKKGNMIITSVSFELKNGEKEDILSKMNELMSRRKEKQPLDFPSAGSTFKRPEGYFAGALIEKNGLKGASVGGAMVSEKHAGFVINYDNAKAEDVKNLINLVAQKVYEADGVVLEPEVLFLGEF